MPIATLAILDLDPAPANFWAAWSFPLLPFVIIVATLMIYLSGWRAARRTRPGHLQSWRAASFTAGILALWIAIASPIDALDDYLLSAHMIQHFLLMSFAPPLIVLGAPTVPLLRGLPRSFRPWTRPFFRARWLHRAVRFILHPVTAWLLMNIAYLGWHIPGAFELTFRSESIHQLEHACFFFTSIAFWWAVLAPWPARRVWPRWTVIPYLLSADILNTILSASLTFSGRVLYPSYLHAQRISSLTALQDQVAAGAEMWVLNSLVFLVPAVVQTFHLFASRSLHALNGSASP